MTAVHEGNYLRATAIAEDGKEANDIRMLKGPQTTRRERARRRRAAARLRARQGNHFVKGLAKDDFTVQEDGRPQTITGFEVAEKLPLTIGLVVDGSGSMEKSMPFVHDASAELFRGLMREKDKGFVIEFREQPRMIQELTGDSARAAARRARAAGARARRRCTTRSSSASTSSARCRAARRSSSSPTAPTTTRTSTTTRCSATPLGGRADLLHRGQHLRSRLRRPQGDQRDRARVGRRGVPRSAARRRSARSPSGSRRSCGRSTSSRSAPTRRSRTASTARSRSRCRSRESRRGRSRGTSPRAIRDFGFRMRALRPQFATTACLPAEAHDPRRAAESSSATRGPASG